MQKPKKFGPTEAQKKDQCDWSVVSNEQSEEGDAILEVSRGQPSVLRTLYLVSLLGCLPCISNNMAKIEP